MSEGQKFPFNVALSQSVQEKAEDLAALGGRLLPAHVVSVSGQIVTVAFDILPEPGVIYPEVTIPVATFEYLRFPIQPGDKGVTLCAQVSLANQSGLGSGLPTRAAPPSLAALYFIPLANTNFSDVDPDKITLYGPAGATIRTQEGETYADLDKERIALVSPFSVKITAPDIYLTGKIHLNGPIVQDAAEMKSTETNLIGPVTVEQTVNAQDVTTSRVSSLNEHDHTVNNVEPGNAQRISTPPNG